VTAARFRIEEIRGRDGTEPEGGYSNPYAAIERERVEWLWPERIPLGMLTLLVGDPGLGKSMLTTELAANASWSGSAVLMLTAEDSPAATVRPRLEAAQADLERVHNATLRRDGVEEGFALPDDVAQLDRYVEATGARLVVIDPLMAHLPAEVNSWRDQSVRTALAPLYRLAEERRCAVVVVAHLNKAKGADPLHRVGGSIGIPGAVRSALLLARDPDDPDGERGHRRVLAHIKCNVAPLAPSLSYEIEPVLLPGDDRIETARLRLLGESEHSGHALLSASADPEQRSELDRAIEHLEAELADGPRDAREARAAVKAAAGVSDRTIDTAKKHLGVQSAKTGFKGGWEWSLSKDATAKSANPISDPCVLRANPHPRAESAAHEPRRTHAEGDSSPVAFLACACSRPARSPRAVGPDLCQNCKRPIGGTG
jgi:hypothetical protein